MSVELQGTIIDSKSDSKNLLLGTETLKEKQEKDKAFKKKKLNEQETTLLLD